MMPCIGRAENPWFVDQFGEIDLPAARPPAVSSRGDNYIVVVQRLRVQVFDCGLFEKRRHPALEEAIIFSLM